MPLLRRPRRPEGLPAPPHERVRGGPRPLAQRSRRREPPAARSASGTRPRSPRATSDLKKTLEACAPFSPGVPLADRRALDDEGREPDRLVPRRVLRRRASPRSSPSAGDRPRSRARSGARDGRRTARPRPVDTDEVRRALIHGLGSPATLVQWNDTRAFEDAGVRRRARRARRRSPPRPARPQDRAARRLHAVRVRRLRLGGDRPALRRHRAVRLGRRRATWRAPRAPRADLFQTHHAAQRQRPRRSATRSGAASSAATAA